MSIWESKKATLFEKIMHTLGWVPRDITRELACAWCGKHQTWTGEATSGPPMFCSKTHKRAAIEARRKREDPSNPQSEAAQARATAKAERRARHEALLAEHRAVKAAKAARASEPPTPPEPAEPTETCDCRNHLGGIKQRYETNGGAAIQLMRRHLPHGGHRIYQCPTSHYWHITSQLVRKDAA